MWPTRCWWVGARRAHAGRLLLQELCHVPPHLAPTIDHTPFLPRSTTATTCRAPPLPQTACSEPCSVHPQRAAQQGRLRRRLCSRPREQRPRHDTPRYASLHSTLSCLTHSSTFPNVPIFNASHGAAQSAASQE